MGENGTGKTTFCKLLAGAEKPDGRGSVPSMNISMKPQKITPKFDGTVRQLFFKKIKASFLNPQFQTDVYKPLKLDDFIDQEVKNLSGGELQRVAIVLALGMPADIYLIDEPSACTYFRIGFFPICTSNSRKIWSGSEFLPQLFLQLNIHMRKETLTPTSLLDLDSEQRIIAARVIKRFIMHAKKESPEALLYYTLFTD